MAMSGIYLNLRTDLGIGSQEGGTDFFFFLQKYSLNSVLYTGIISNESVCVQTLYTTRYTTLFIE